MTKSIIILIIVSIVSLAAIIIVSVLLLMRNKNKKKLNNSLMELEREKNNIISSALLSEFKKIDTLNNNKIKKKIEGWKSTFDSLQNKSVPLINDQLIEIENKIVSKKYKEALELIAKCELDLYYVKINRNDLLESIREITLSEERNREVVTKLKSVYRGVINKYNKNKDDYKEISSVIELQFENIDKLFSAFERCIEESEYEEISKIVKALDDTIKNIEVIIDESPTVLFMDKIVLPKKINDLKNAYNKMLKNGYFLGYMNVEYNLEEAEKKLNDIYDRLKMLDIEDSVFDLKTMLDYFESIFTDFDKEKSCKKNYDNNIKKISDKISKLTVILKNIYVEMETIKNTYDLSPEEINSVNVVNASLVEVKDEFKLLSDRTRLKVTAYSKISKELDLLNIKLSKIEETIEETIKGLSSLKEDEVRARDQLIEIRGILREARNKMKNYNLPIIPKNYFVELKEAEYAVRTIIDELEKKPISINTLNTRVDTARDLALKLYNTSNELTKTAAMAELAIVYGNRYRSTNKEVEEGLSNAEKEFYKGNYRSSLEIVLNALNIVEPGIHKKLIEAYQR